jgi:predicted TIM-barrel fold metal-dependent hydrolase
VIVDGLTFLGESLHGYRATAAELLAALDTAEIDAAVVCPVRPPGYHLGPANELVAEAARRHPGRLHGFARVDPNLGEAAVEEAERALGELGLRGLFLHPWEETFRIGAQLVVPVVEVARAHGVPVLVAAGYPWLSEGLQVGALAQRHPKVVFIATNGGQINISGLGQTDVELALADNPNLLIESAGVYREDFLEGVVARFGAGRLVFASAFPLLDPRLEIRRVQWAHLDGDDRERILGGTLERLLGRG